MQTILLFVFIGPPIGCFSLAAIAMIVGFAKVVLGAQSMNYFMDNTFILISPLAIFLSYMIGGLQALAAGFLICIYEWFRGRLGGWGAALVGFLTSVPIILSNFRAIYPPTVLTVETVSNTALMSGTTVLYHVIPTLFCYRLASRARYGGGTDE
ncbi:hypothetical protein [Phyllobacterium sp. YR531]|uniref:hypothetical protein n=1 Tax=Phyllobacterium sp. YR531 TaxID=1144343 RepID=UPI00026FB2CC|nr:hypothetical protein [Phyllobacterium sp. YR531]EJM99364.1 hypothetical protein PMI41_04268 [Phyllobacterium sp. YR531]